LGESLRFGATSDHANFGDGRRANAASACAFRRGIGLSPSKFERISNAHCNRFSVSACRTEDQSGRRIQRAFVETVARRTHQFAARDVTIDVDGQMKNDRGFEKVEFRRSSEMDVAAIGAREDRSTSPVESYECAIAKRRATRGMPRSTAQSVGVERDP
jgi:hypothetical protein